jgi:hypothetical protein
VTIPRTYCSNYCTTSCPPYKPNAHTFLFSSHTANISSSAIDGFFSHRKNTATHCRLDILRLESLSASYTFANAEYTHRERSQVASDLLLYPTYPLFTPIHNLSQGWISHFAPTAHADPDITFLMLCSEFQRPKKSRFEAKAALPN